VLGEKARVVFVEICSSQNSVGLTLRVLYVESIPTLATNSGLDQSNPGVCTGLCSVLIILRRCFLLHTLHDADTEFNLAATCGALPELAHSMLTGRTGQKYSFSCPISAETHRKGRTCVKVSQVFRPLLGYLSEYSLGYDGVLA